LSGKCAAAVTSHTTVGIDNDLASSQACIAHGPTNDEASSGINVVLRIRVEKVLGNRLLNDLLEHFGAQTTVVHSLAVLSRDHHRVHADGFVVCVIFNCDL